MVRPRQDGLPSAKPDRRKLSNFVVNSLKPKEQPYAVWDTELRGFAVMVLCSSRKSWKVVYSRNARKRWYHLGDASAVGLSDARKLAATILLRVAQGEDPQANRAAERGSGTFKDLAERYRQYAERRNKSWRQADWLVRTYLLPRWGGLRAADIAKSDVKDMMGRISAPITANQVLASASAIFTWAVKEELASVKVNPCHKVERNETKSRTRIIPDIDIPKFWSRFDDAGLVRGAAIKTTLFLGQRPGEVRAMRTEHIVDNWWELPGEPVPELGWPGTKNAQPHRVWLPKPVVEIIRQLEPNGFVFANTRGGMIDDLAPAMRAICKSLGAPRTTPHDLRRTHGSAITGLGFGTDAMNRIQNHREGGIASVYDQHKYAEENKRIMEAVANKFMTLVEGGPSNVVDLRLKK
jgi:integrase